MTVVDDGEISDLEIEVDMTANHDEQVSSSGATKEHPSMLQSSDFPIVEKANGNKTVTENLVSKQLSDNELANLPRVKNLFNRFWEEKMKELNKGKDCETTQRSGEFIKLPSDTTIYAPALMRSSQVPVKNTERRQKH